MDEEQRDLTLDLYNRLVEKAIDSLSDDPKNVNGLVNDITELGKLINESYKIDNEFYIANAKVVADEKHSEKDLEYREKEIILREKEIVLKEHELDSADNRANNELIYKKFETGVAIASVAVSVIKLMTFVRCYDKGLAFDIDGIQTSSTAKHCSSHLFKFL